MKKLLLLLPVFAVLALASCSDVRIKEHPEWKTYFDHYGVEGCFEFYDNNKEMAYYYNRERCNTRYSPASTFKIFNSLVGLQTSIAPDEQMVIKWDGVQRWNPDWNKDLTMKEAFKVSAVPYYQELARRIGREEMQHYLDTVQYGNMRIGDSIDQFWLNDTLKITADEQVGFMKRLYHGELPFNERAQRIVKSMMLQKESADYKLYYKTGWYKGGATDLLWIVGFIEKIERLKNVETGKIEGIPHPYFFALNFTSRDTAASVATMQKMRLDLLQQLLQANGLDK